MADRARKLRMKMKKEFKAKEEEEKKIEEEKKKFEEKKIKFRQIVIEKDSDDSDGDPLPPKKEEKEEEKPKEPETPKEEIDPLSFFERPSAQIEIQPENPLLAMGIKIENTIESKDDDESDKDDKKNNDNNQETEGLDRKTPFGVMKLSLMDIMGAKLSLKGGENGIKEKEEKERKEKEEKEKKLKAQNKEENKDDNTGPKKLIKTLDEKNKEILEQLQLESQNNADAAKEVTLPELEISKKKALFKRLNSNKRKVISFRLKRGLNQDLSEIIIQKIEELKKIPNFNAFDKIQIILDKRALPKYIFEEDDDVQKINDNDESYPEDRKANIDLAFIMRQTPTSNIVT